MAFNGLTSSGGSPQQVDPVGPSPSSHLSPLPCRPAPPLSLLCPRPLPLPSPSSPLPPSPLLPRPVAPELDMRCCGLPIHQSLLSMDLRDACRAAGVAAGARALYHALAAASPSAGHAVVHEAQRVLLPHLAAALSHHLVDTHQRAQPSLKCAQQTAHTAGCTQCPPTVRLHPVPSHSEAAPSALPHLTLRPPHLAPPALACC